jgi:hypothetical protein
MSTNPHSLRHGAKRRKGAVHEKEYHSYCAAKQRCQDRNLPAYKNYGGRGIEFKFNSFEEFLAELGPKPTPQHGVDRYPNNDGNYEPGNVRWANRSEQNKNRRPFSEETCCKMRGPRGQYRPASGTQFNVIPIEDIRREYFDESYTLRQIAVKYGCDKDTIANHLTRAGYTLRPSNRVKFLKEVA